MRLRKSVALTLITTILMALVQWGTASAWADDPIATPTANSSETEAPKFMIRAVGDHPENYFDDIEVAPGATLELAVSIVNFGVVPVDLRTYKVNALNSVNGGYVSGKETDLPVGLTSWIDYPTQAFSLAPGEQQEIAFTIHVPEDAQPGQYISGLVVQTQDPLPIPGTESLRQVLAYAISVGILVPGEITQSFELGEPEFTDNAGLRRIRIPVTNTGNYLVRPTGNLSLTAPNGEQVLDSTVDMRAIYAGLSTHLEVVLPEQLQPGEYRLNVSLQDEPSGTSDSIVDAPLTVPEPVDPFGLAVEEVSIQPNANPIVFANVEVTVQNHGGAIASTDVLLKVKLDGVEVESFALADNQILPNGETVLTARYLPADVWQPGTYTFEIVVSAVDPEGGTETILATIDVEDEITVP